MFDNTILGSESIVANMDSDTGIGVDFSFFSGEKASKIDSGVPAEKPKKKNAKIKVAYEGIQKTVIEVGGRIAKQFT